MQPYTRAIALFPDIPPAAQILYNKYLSRQRQCSAHALRGAYRSPALALPAVLVGTYRDGRLTLTAARCAPSNFLPMREALAQLVDQAQGSGFRLSVTVDQTQLTTPATVNSAQQITIRLEPHADVVQMSPAQIARNQRTSPLEQTNLVTRIGDAAVLRQNVFQRQIAERVIGEKILEQVAQLQVTVPSTNFVVPFYSVVQSRKINDQDTCKKANEELVNSALKRFRFAKFCRQLAEDPEQFLQKEAAKQAMRRKMLLGGPKIELLDGEYTTETAQQGLMRMEGAMQALAPQVLANLQGK